MTITFKNSFGIPTDPLNFRRRLPAETHRPFLDALIMSLRSLGLGDADSSSLVTRFYEILDSNSDPRSTAKKFKEEISSLGSISFDNAKEEALRLRAETIDQQISGYLRPGSILDWGCGDGIVASRLSSEHSVSIVDIYDHRRDFTKQPIHFYDQVELPNGLDQKYENVLLLTVLHHARNPALTCRHACSVADRVIVIESVPEIVHPALSRLAEIDRLVASYEYCGFVDWFYNQVICDDVHVAYNYLPSSAWEQLFTAAGFEIEAREVLGIDQNIVPEWHVLYVFVRSEKNPTIKT